MSFYFLVINVCNHGEHYETPCILQDQTELMSYEEIIQYYDCLSLFLS
jgi:hypothetical protein